MAVRTCTSRSRSASDGAATWRRSTRHRSTASNGYGRSSGPTSSLACIASTPRSAVARTLPAVVDHLPAARWLTGELAHPTPDLLTVVCHSIVLQYLGPDERTGVLGAIEAAGARVTPERTVGWVRMEPGGPYAEVRVTTWPGGITRLVATSRFHGPPVHWLRWL